MASPTCPERRHTHTHFVRACAIEMHLEISQEQLYTEIYRRNARAQNEPRTQTHTLCELARSKCTWKFYKSHFIPKFKGKMPVPRVNPERGHTLCASLRSRNALGDFTRATLHEHLQVKAADQEQAKLAPQILCEPARSKCTWRFHKSHCMRKFAGKMPRLRPQNEHPDQAYRKNPSAWTREQKQQQLQNLQLQLHLRQHQLQLQLKTLPRWGNHRLNNLEDDFIGRARNGKAKCCNVKRHFCDPHLWGNPAGVNNRL